MTSNGHFSKQTVIIGAPQHTGQVSPNALG